jgi:hypothetical protein
LSYSQLLDAMVVTVPEGSSGDVSIKRFTIAEEDVKRYNFMSTFTFGGGGRNPKPGTYTALKRGRSLWMSDTPAERYDHIQFVMRVAREQCKSVLITGLGIGMVAQALTMIPSIERVTVVELDEDVIKLVGPHLGQMYGEAGKWLDIVQGDATDPKQLEGLPDIQWDAAWHDIWPNICADNWEDMKVMRRKWRSRLSKLNGFQEFWCECEVKDLVRRDRANSRMWKY